MQPLSTSVPQPAFGFGLFPSQAQREAMLQAQFRLSQGDGKELLMQSDAFMKRYCATSIPMSLGGLGLGLLGARFVKQGMRQVILPMVGMLVGQIVAGVIHWPESKRLYAALREKSLLVYPAFVDKLYGYKPSSN